MDKIWLGKILDGYYQLWHFMDGLITFQESTGLFTDKDICRIGFGLVFIRTIGKDLNSHG